MRYHKFLLVLALAGLTATGVGTAIAKTSSTKAKSKVTIKALGKTTFKINRAVINGLRWSKDVVNIKSGGTLTIVNAVEEPHSFSVVKAKQLPKTTKQLNQCKICAALGAAHQVDEMTGVAGKPILDVGKPGFDQPGDSELISPKGAPGSTIKVKITAAKGTTLNFMCAIHSWMQAKVVVH